jgi:hypothetical protein
VFYRVLATLRKKPITFVFIAADKKEKFEQTMNLFSSEEVTRIKIRSIELVSALKIEPADGYKPSDKS